MAPRTITTIPINTRAQRATAKMKEIKGDTYQSWTVEWAGFSHSMDKLEWPIFAAILTMADAIDAETVKVTVGWRDGKDGLFVVVVGTGEVADLTPAAEPEAESEAV